MKAEPCALIAQNLAANLKLLVVNRVIGGELPTMLPQQPYGRYNDSDKTNRPEAPTI